MSVTIAILGLAVLILIHEAGHFFVARAVGMRPRRFYLGFPPAIVKKTHNGVEYGIGAIPLGGYVKIPGMHRSAPGDVRGSLKPEELAGVSDELDILDAALERGDEEAARAQLPKLEPLIGGNRMFQELDGSLAPDAYWRQATWKKVAVIAAGPAVNLVTAIALFVALFMVGPLVGTRTVESTVKNFPAATAGIRAGDEILTIAGHPITSATLATRINATHGRPIEVTLLRGGKRLTIGPLRARLDKSHGTPAYRIGIGMALAPRPGQSLPTATWSATKLTWDVTSGELKGIARLFVGQGTHDISSSVGIVRVTAQAYRTSLRDYFFFIGLISLILALLNLLPILPLDGGHIAMSLLERVRGRAFSQLAYLRYSAVGLTLFMFLLYLGLRNDFSGGS
jgi:regulator of sigma E protease